MEKADYLRPGDEVTVRILGPKGKELYKSTSNGYHNLDDAVNAAIENAGLDINPADCVFEVSNLSNDVSHQYRLNAHGHLKLIL